MKAFMIMMLMMASLFTPFSYTIKLEKEEICENRPFAGIVNGHTVGTAMATKLWLTPEDIPDGTYRITTTPFLWLIGDAAYSLE